MRCSVVLSPTNIALVPASRRPGLRRWDRPGQRAPPSTTATTTGRTVKDGAESTGRAGPPLGTGRAG